MLTIIVIFIIINILLAKKDTKKILANQRIDHIFNTLLYSGLMVLLTAVLVWLKFSNLHIIIIIFSVLLTRKVVFDLALNKYRHKSLFYISLTTTSKIDQLENRIFSYNGKIKYFIYGLIWAITIISYYIFL